MPEAKEATDIALALHALAALLDDDAVLASVPRQGLSVLLAQLARRLDGVGSALWDRGLPA